MNYSIVKLNEDGTPLEVIGFWSSKDYAYRWAKLMDISNFVVVPHYRI